MPSVVWHLSLPLMNSFNKTRAAIFPCRVCFLKSFSFSQLNLPYVQGVLPVSGVVGVWSRAMLVSIVAGTLVEATSDQIDNLVVPLFTLTTLAASLQME